MLSSRSRKCGTSYLVLLAEQHLLRILVKSEHLVPRDWCVVHVTKGGTGNLIVGNLLTLILVVRGRKRLDTVGAIENSIVAQHVHKVFVHNSNDIARVQHNIVLIFVLVLILNKVVPSRHGTGGTAFALRRAAWGVLVVRVGKGVTLLQVIGENNVTLTDFIGLVLPAGTKNAG